MTKVSDLEYPIANMQSTDIGYKIIRSTDRFIASERRLDEMGSERDRPEPCQSPRLSGAREAPQGRSFMKSDHEIHALVRAFEDCTLARAEWTHRQHLIVALCYLRRHGREEATRRIRQGIQHFNRSHENPTGYHETITLAWIAVISRFRAREDRDQPLSVLVEALLGECGEKDHLLRFYSLDLLMSEEARRTWVPPDLQAIE
jgi:hypothetical protein